MAYSATTDEALLNYLPSSVTFKAPNELAYDIQLNRPLNLLSKAEEQQSSSPTIARIDAADAISFTQMQQKFHYDRRHQPMYFRTGDEAFLRLHKGYSTPSVDLITKKLGQQYVGPFKILDRVGKQAYRISRLTGESTRYSR